MPLFFRRPIAFILPFLAGSAAGIYEIALIRLARVMFRFDSAFIFFALAIFFILLGNISSIWFKPGKRDFIILSLAFPCSAILCSLTDISWYILIPFLPLFFIGRVNALFYSRPLLNRCIYIAEMLGLSLGLTIAGPHIIRFVQMPGALSFPGLVFLGLFFLSGRAPFFNYRFSGHNQVKRQPLFYCAVLIFIFSPFLINHYSNGYLVKRAATVQTPVSTHLREKILQKGLKSLTTFESLASRTDQLVCSDDSIMFFTDAMFCAKAVRIDKSLKIINPQTEKAAFLKRLPFLIVKVPAPFDESTLIDQPDTLVSDTPGAETPCFARVLNLGAGAGFDTLIALEQGALKVTALEINKAITEQALKLEHTSGRLYNYPEVELVNAEARTWLEKSTKNYDFITLSLMESSDSAGPGAMFIHAPLFTEQAFELYFSRLTRQGMIGVIHNRPEPLETNISTCIRALKNRGGIKNPFDHLLAVKPLVPFKNSFDHLLLVSRQAFSKELINRTKQILAREGQFYLSLKPPQLHRPERDHISRNYTCQTDTPDVPDVSDVPQDNRPFLFSGIYGFKYIYWLILFALAIPVGSGFFIIRAAGLSGTQRVVPRFLLCNMCALFLTAAAVTSIQTALLYLAQSVYGFPAAASAAAASVSALASAWGVSVFSKAHKKSAFLPFGAVFIWTAIYFVYSPFDTGKEFLYFCLFVSFIFTGLIFAQTMSSPGLNRLPEKLKRQSIALYLFADGAGCITGACAALLFAFTYGYSGLFIMGGLAFTAGAAIKLQTAR